MQNVWLSDKQVAERYSVSRITVWRWSKDETLNFPKPRKLSANVTRWLASELQAFDKRMQEAA